MSNELSIPPMTGPNDRTMSLSATSSERLPALLEEIQERSRLIRLWIRDQMTPGVHYGVPPGVNQNDRDPSRWTSKPSLYQAGADAVIASEKVVPEFEPDEAAWRMLGSQTGRMVYRCRLRSQLTGVVIGEGVGAARILENADDFNLNKGIKMACKRAKVAAVLNAYALSDLFTQDLEDGKNVAPPEVPDQAADAPVVPPRGDRVTADDLNALSAAWRDWRMQNEMGVTAADFKAWACGITGIPTESLKNTANWSRQKLNECHGRLGNAP